MKDNRVLVALIIGASLIISVSIVASAVKSLGVSLERAALLQSNQRTVSIPSTFTIRMSDDGNPVRVELRNK